MDTKQAIKKIDTPKHIKRKILLFFAETSVPGILENNRKSTENNQID